MTNDPILSAPEADDTRRSHRRDFLRTAGSVSAAVAGASLLAACGGNDSNPAPTPTPTPTASTTPTPTPSPVSNADILNFALNLAYLEAQYFSVVTTGAGLSADLLTGTGTPGAATGGRARVFTDPVVAQYARELAADTRTHVAFLRGVIGSTVIAQPAIDLGVTATSAFSNLARAAGLITTAAATYDVYESDERVMLGAFVFADVAVTAYRGIAASLTGAAFLDALSGMQAAKAYHAGLIRSVLYRKGIATPAILDATEALSTARDSLEGATDIDQGVKPVNNASNIVPTDGSGLTFNRAPAQVLNVHYLTRASVSAGGFFPAGVNGPLKTSTAA
ncbi:ferritin-like domain-containing protein [Sphingomonas sp. 2R-10]|uniref:ferritin-like domain-containing protein n=1 Tax=Sphingomonas sp. 2R-10 TaxID=3045148 RepID=UPI000F77444A|nr:ferritin-like domain-containing protein [Sphingomonas sp. 2R-10]MDJ0277906.1 ferritin-like domain-containing protein [Sphingomonas sp. 2R-10]